MLKGNHSSSGSCLLAEVKKYLAEFDDALAKYIPVVLVAIECVVFAVKLS